MFNKHIESLLICINLFLIIITILWFLNTVSNQWIVSCVLCVCIVNVLFLLRHRFLIAKKGNELQSPLDQKEQELIALKKEEKYRREFFVVGLFRIN